jgi:exopolysaccharide biosynthesis polyprenyl glycosylphosphotransferase
VTAHGGELIPAAGTATLVPTSSQFDAHRPDFTSANDDETAEHPPFQRPRASTLRHLVILADLIAILVGIGVTFVVQAHVKPIPRAIQIDHARLALVSLPAWLLALGANKMYTSRAIEQRGEELRRLLTSCLIGLASIVGLAFAWQYSLLSRLWVGSLLLFVFGTIAIERGMTRHAFNMLRRTGRITRRVAIIGTDDHAVSVMRSVQRNASFGYDVVGLIGDGVHDVPAGVEVLGSADDTGELLRLHGCNGAIISMSSVDSPTVNRLTRRLTDDGFHIALLSSLRDIDLGRIRPQRLDGQALIYVEPTVRNGWRAHAKRAFDIVVSVLALLVMAPFLVLAAIAIGLESGGPILFRQSRVGRDGEEFAVLKLRTMHADAEERRAELMALNEADGPLFKIRNDPRITKVGRILRKLSIDEFPQFWNVLKGEMSVVGPRPALPSEVAQWDPELHERLRVLPGITGLWQVSGRADASFEDYKRLDLYYVDNWSLLHDVQIMFRTLGTITLQRGAH